MVVQFVALGLEFDHLPDDPVVGTTTHQAATALLYDSLHWCGAGRGLPWLVAIRLPLVVPWSDARLAPDLLVHATLGNSEREQLDQATDGPPALIIEVTSPQTSLDADLCLIADTGMKELYGVLGVQEYLVFDPTGELIPGQVRAWRAGAAGYEPWLAEGDGRWHSRSLGISFMPQGMRLRVYGQDGQLVPTIREIAAARRQLEAENRRLRGE
jgi:Uma2 family endonuclease